MGVPKAVRHSQLLAIPLAERCRAATPVAKQSQPCRSLFGDGWGWHSCDLGPDTHSEHHCPCHHTWTATNARNNRRNR